MPSNLSRLWSIHAPEKEQEAFITVVEAGLAAALAQSSPGTQSLGQSSVWGHRCIMLGWLIIGLPWLDVTSSITSGMSCGMLLPPSPTPRSRAAASAYLRTYKTRSSVSGFINKLISSSKIAKVCWISLEALPSVSAKGQLCFYLEMTLCLGETWLASMWMITEPVRGDVCCTSACDSGAGNKNRSSVWQKSRNFTWKKQQDFTGNICLVPLLLSMITKLYTPYVKPENTDY